MYSYNNLGIISYLKLRYMKSYSIIKQRQVMIIFFCYTTLVNFKFFCCFVETML
jgi:hypothetical protein